MGNIKSAIRKASPDLYMRRVEKVISQPKPTMHPFYATEAKLMARIRTSHPELHSKVVERRMDLEENVNKLRITPSTIGTKGNVFENEQKKRSLPAARESRTDYEHGFFEPSKDEMQPNRVGFTRLLVMLRMAQRDDRSSKPSSTKELAKRYGIEETVAEAIIKYFAPFSYSVDYEEPRAKTHQSIREIEDETKEIIEQLAYTKLHGKIITQAGARQMMKKIEEFKAKNENKTSVVKDKSQ